MKALSTLVFAGLISYLPVTSANDAAQHFAPVTQLDTSANYRLQIREKFLHKMADKCPPIFNAQNCSCVSSMMFDELTPVQQSLIGEGFAFAQRYPEKTELEISKMIEAKFGADNLQKKDIRARWQRAQLQAFNTCKLPF